MNKPALCPAFIRPLAFNRAARAGGRGIVSNLQTGKLLVGVCPIVRAAKLC